MVVELAHIALWFAFGLALLQAGVAPWAAFRRDRALLSVVRPLAYGQFLLVALSFAGLTYAFVTSDFSLRLVVLNSHSLKPMIYKVSGVWANHEGSMLLWVLIFCGFGAAVASFSKNLPMTFLANVLGVKAMVAAAFLAFVIFTSNPFLRLIIPPFDGQDLNPLLQDPGVAFHPPTLYLGYVGLGTSFCFAVAALIEGRVDAAWGRWVRPWTLAAWMFLTLGICLGSWWAYYELGWGGFWFWDPVENASFMPWLFAAALLHSAVVVEKREAFKIWTILLAILAFGFSLIGTFIVRSGLLTSVHAFANDPERGVFILLILCAALGGALTLFALRAHKMGSRAVFSMVSREGALIANNVLLAVSSLVVFVGTMWPLVAEAITGQVLSVGPPFFNIAFTPFMVVLGLLLPIGSSLGWKRGTLNRAFARFWPAAVLALALAGLAWAMAGNRSLVGPVGLFLGAWIISGAVLDSFVRGGKTVRVRLRGLKRSEWGKFVAHSGLGITMFAVAAMTAWEQEDIRVVQLGESWNFGGYELRLESVEEVPGPNYSSQMAQVALIEDGVVTALLRPEKRFYPVAQMPTTEAAIDYRFLRDVYVVLGDAQQNGGYAMRSYIKPFANWIWGGCAIMALGAILSLSDRRHRVASGVRRTSSAMPLPQGTGG